MIFLNSRLKKTVTCFKTRPPDFLKLKFNVHFRGESRNDFLYALRDNDAYEMTLRFASFPDSRQN